MKPHSGDWPTPKRRRLAGVVTGPYVKPSQPWRLMRWLGWVLFGVR
jgi:hypothetical protein